MLNIFQRFKDYTHRRDLFVKKDNLKTYNGNIELNYTKLIMLFALSAIFYSAFVLLSKTIHHIRTNPDLTDVSAWLLGFAQENDGIELYVMTFAMPIYILSSYIIINYLKINFNSMPFARFGIGYTKSYFQRTSYLYDFGAFCFCYYNFLFNNLFIKFQVFYLYKNISIYQPIHFLYFNMSVGKYGSQHF